MEVNLTWQVERVVDDKKEYLNLLLLADPDETMVDRYLDRGEMFILTVGGEVVAEAVICPKDDPHCCELKNLAVREKDHRKGYGTFLVNWCCRRYAESYGLRMQVGTAEAGIGFYEKLNFTISHTVLDFFTENYPNPL